MAAFGYIELHEASNTRTLVPGMQSEQKEKEIQPFTIPEFFDDENVTEGLSEAAAIRHPRAH